MKAVVHKTKGRLDLRSITVFGMNSKPETTTPIGYFGTGLKYAIAVLARNNISVKIYIDGKLWVIEKDPATFRNKSFTELYICSTTIGGLIKKRIKLPFTTELGKNWGLWQAFRELESNTRDENGETFLVDSDDVSDLALKGFTAIQVDGEEYVEEFNTRDKTFIPGGLTLREGNDAVQVFKQPSQHVYYRSIRIFDLPKDMPSQYTYNILAKIELTEDRTAKEPYFVKMMIENFIATHKDPEVIKTVVTAPHRTYERSFSFKYGAAPSQEFIDTLESIDDKIESVNSSAIEIRDERRPKEQIMWHAEWQVALIQALEKGNWVKVQEIYDDNKEALKEILQVKESDFATEDTTIQPEIPNVPGRTEETDDIPF